MSISPPVPKAVPATDRPLYERAPIVPPWARRELTFYGVALLLGLVGMPFLIWYAGNRLLGPYTHGPNPHAGPFALLADFFGGLFRGSAVFWAVALGPAALLLLLRLFVLLVRALPPMRQGQPRPPP